jgi:hypothetical protein
MSANRSLCSTSSTERAGLQLTCRAACRRLGGMRRRGRRRGHRVVGAVVRGTRTPDGLAGRLDADQRTQLLDRGVDHRGGSLSDVPSAL